MINISPKKSFMPIITKSDYKVTFLHYCVDLWIQSHFVRHAGKHSGTFPHPTLQAVKYGPITNTHTSQSLFRRFYWISICMYWAFLALKRNRNWCRTKITLRATLDVQINIRHASICISTSNSLAHGRCGPNCMIALAPVTDPIRKSF